MNEQALENFTKTVQHAFLYMFIESEKKTKIAKINLQFQFALRIQ